MLVSLVAIPLQWWLRNEGIPLSDESHYAHAAMRWVESGIPTTGATVFDHRWGLIYPITWLIKCFGTHYLVLTAWSSICFLGTLVFVWFFMRSEGKTNAQWAVALLATNPAMIWASVNISPDIVATLMMCIAMAMIAPSQYWQTTIPPLIRGLIFGISCTWAFLAKETVVFFAIPILYLAVIDLKSRQNLHFWLVSGVTLIICALLYGWLYFEHTGDVLHRFHVLNQDYLAWAENPFSYAGKPITERLHRLFIRPIPFFLKEPGYVLLLISLGLTFLKKRIMRPTGLATYALLITASVGLYFVFGTVSLNAYIPITLVDRMILPVLPWLIIWTVTRINTEPSALNVRANYLLIALASVSLTLALGTSRSYTQLPITALFCCLMILLLRSKWPQQSQIWLSVLFVFQLSTTLLSPRNLAYFTERNLLQQVVKQSSQSIIATDRRMAAMYRSHIDFQPVMHNKVIWWDSLSTDKMMPVYILRNHNREQSAVIERGQVPAQIQAQPTDILYYRDAEIQLWYRPIE
jgi:4-amino-4-deoxy-L-arabinose transferase-like glycosyltransferase